MSNCTLLIENAVCQYRLLHFGSSNLIGQKVSSSTPVNTQSCWFCFSDVDNCKVRSRLELSCGKWTYLLRIEACEREHACNAKLVRTLWQKSGKLLLWFQYVYLLSNVWSLQAVDCVLFRTNSSVFIGKQLASLLIQDFNTASMSWLRRQAGISEKLTNLLQDERPISILVDFRELVIQLLPYCLQQEDKEWANGIRRYVDLCTQSSATLSCQKRAVRIWVLTIIKHFLLAPIQLTGDCLILRQQSVKREKLLQSP